MFGDESLETELMEVIEIASQQPSSSKVQILASSANPEPGVLKTPASADKGAKRKMKSKQRGEKTKQAKLEQLILQNELIKHQRLSTFEMTELQSKDNFRLSLTYSHGVHFIGSIQNNSKIMVLEIDSEHTDPNFLTEDSFYGALNSADNLFFVDVNMGQTAFTSQIESHILKKLNDCNQSSLIMQCRSKPMTKVFVKDNKKGSIVPLDLCDDVLQVNNEKFSKLLLSDKFGVPLLIKGIKSNIAGEFLDEPSLSLGNVKFDVEKEFNRWNLVDHAAAHDDFLSARFLTLHGKWNLSQQNSDKRRTLDIAAEYASVKTMKAILNLALSQPSCNENMPLDSSISSLLQTKDLYGNTPLSIIVEKGRQDEEERRKLVNFFIQNGSDLNHQNSCRKSAIDLALEKKDYEIATLLLEAADFPNLEMTFGLKTIDTNNIPDKLRCFIERERLRSWIRDETNEDEKLQQTDIIDLIEKSNKDGYLKMKQGKYKISKWSLDRKQFKIYAFLQSLGICIDDEKEISDYVKQLTDADKDELQKCIEEYFVPIPSAHILFLTSKSIASKPTNIETFKKKVEKWFRELDEIDEISIILKVIAQYPILEEIIFDEERSSTIGADVYGSNLEKGVLVIDFEKGTICVGAKQQEPREFLGILAHELTHLAMHQVYKNKGKPYEEDSDNGNRFGKITTDIKEKKERNKELDGIISSVFEIQDYSDILDEELIVRVPHILAKSGKEEGAKILSDQAPKLFEYYKEKVMPRCDRYIKERNLIKPRNNIKLLIPFLEVFNRIKTSIVKFKEPIQIDFLSQEQKENYLLIETENTFFTGCSVYQSLLQISDYSKSCNYLFLRTDQFKETLLSVCETDAINLLVFICDDKIGLTHIDNVINDFKIILKTQKYKKIIFIIPQGTEDCFKNKIAGEYSKQTDKAYTLNDLTKESQEEFFKMSIKFQGQTIRFGNLMDKENTELKKLIDSQMLDKLQKNEVEIHCDIPHFRGYDVDYYINRRFCRKVRISGTIFQDNDNNNLFAISEAHIGDLTKDLDQKCSFLGVEKKDISEIKLVVLDNQKADEQFDQLCTKAKNRNIHWIKDEKGALIWQQTYGSISRLIKYRELENSENIAASFYQEEINVLSKRLLIIADSAGMGKSSILVHLEKILKETWPNLWVIRVELNNYTEVLSEELERRIGEQPSFSGSTNAIEFLLNDLLESRLKSTLGKELFKHSLFKCPDKTTIMLDGFDEISPNYKEIVLDLLHALKETGCKLLVTTRPSMGPDLEERLNEFAYTLEPFTEATQKDFLIKFWKKKLCVTNEQKKALDVYASKLNNKFRISISDKERKFLSIPLQLRMVAEIFQKNTTGTSEDWQGCQEFIESYEYGEELRLGTKIDLPNLYERFMKKKFYEFYWRDKINLDFTKPGMKGIADQNYNSVKEEHALLSLHRLLSSEDLNKLLNSSDMEINRCSIEYIKNGENKIGIIDSVIYDKPHFVHLTFAEYLAPIYFTKKMFLNPEIAFQLINNIIINTSPVFIYCLTKEMSKKESEMKNLLQGKTLVNYLIQNGYYDFARVLLESGYEDYPQPDIHNETPLHYSVKSGNLKLVLTVLNIYYHIYKKNISKWFGHDETYYWYVSSDLEKFVNQRDRDNKTAIFYAAKIACEQEPKEYMEITCELLKRGADDNKIKEYIKTIKFENNYSNAYYMRGFLQKGLRNYNKALADFKKCIELDPTDARAYNRRGDLQNELGNYNEAMADYTKAIELDPTDEDAYYSRGDLQKILGNYNEAIADYTKPIEWDPTNAYAYYRRGDLQKELGNYNEAIADYTNSIELDPTDEDAYYSRGDLQKELGNYNEAMADYTKPIELDPTDADAYYSRGDLQKKLGNYNEAMADFIKAIELDPTNAYAYYRRGDLQKELGNYNEAIADYTQAIELNPTYADAYNNRGIAQYNLGKYNEAIADYTQAIELNPTYADAYNNRGIAQYNLGKYNEAIADYTQAIELNPTYAYAYNNRGIAQYNLGKYNEAIADYTQAIELNPTYADAYNNRGIAQDNLGKYNEAIADYTQAIELNPTHAYAYYNRGIAQDNLGKYNEAIADYTQAIELNPTYADAYNNRGIAQDNLGKYNEAIADYTKAIELDPTFAFAYNNRGIAQYNLGKYNEAIADYTQAIELNPNDAEAYNNRGNAQSNLGKYNEAIADCTKAIELDPTDVDAYNNRGIAHKNLGKYNEAIADYTQAIELNPTYAYAYYNRGLAHKNLGKYNEAIADYTQAIELNPTHAYAYYNRGIAQDNLGKYNEAIADYTKAIELDPTFAFAYNNRGIAQYNLGKYNEAIADYTQAIELNPNDAEAYNNRGNAQSNLGKYNEAIADCTKAIELDPTDVDAYNNRGIAHKNLGKYNEAIADYTQAIELNPTYAYAYYNRGLAHKNLGKYNEAIADYTQAIELNPTHAYAYYNRGIAQDNLGKYNEAIADYTKAIELDPTFAFAYNNRGIAQYNLGKYNEAIADCTKAIELDPTDVDAYYNIGNAHLELGQFSNAIIDYTKFMSLNPYDNRRVSKNQLDQRNNKVKPEYEFYIEWNSLYALVSQRT